MNNYEEKILEIGSSSGFMLTPLKKYNNKLFGIEPSLDFRKYTIKKGIQTFENFDDLLKMHKSSFDLIMHYYVLEHIDDPIGFLKNSMQLLKKNGIMFVATLNKTLKSYLFAIIGAEYILRWLPIGTHDWEKFVKPEELENILNNYNLVLDRMNGMKLNIIKDEWNISSDKSINYIAKFIKT